jgi:hypothetical protein
MGRGEAQGQGGPVSGRAGDRGNPAGGGPRRAEEGHSVRRGREARRGAGGAAPAGLRGEGLPPDIKAADIKAPDIKAPDIKAADTKAPHIKAADIKAADIKAADIKAADIKAPDIKAPDIKAPDIKAPDIGRAGRPGRPTCERAWKLKERAPPPRR